MKRFIVLLIASFVVGVTAGLFALTGDSSAADAFAWGFFGTFTLGGFGLWSWWMFTEG